MLGKGVTGRERGELLGRRRRGRGVEGRENGRSGRGRGSENRGSGSGRERGNGRGRGSIRTWNANGCIICISSRNRCSTDIHPLPKCIYTLFLLVVKHHTTMSMARTTITVHITITSSITTTRPRPAPPPYPLQGPSAARGARNASVSATMMGARTQATINTLRKLSTSPPPSRPPLLGTPTTISTLPPTTGTCEVNMVRAEGERLPRGLRRR